MGKLDIQKLLSVGSSCRKFQADSCQIKTGGGYKLHSIPLYRRFKAELRTGGLGIQKAGNTESIQKTRPDKLVNGLLIFHSWFSPFFYRRFQLKTFSQEGRKGQSVYGCQNLGVYFIGKGNSPQGFSFLYHMGAFKGNGCRGYNRSFIGAHIPEGGYSNFFAKL